MKKIFIIVLFITLASCSVNTLEKKYTTQIENQIEYTVDIKSDYFEISFKNTSSVNKYLLTSYLNNRFTYNEHLYKKSNDTISVSYIPILEHLGTLKSDVLIIENTALFKPMQTIYEFRTIKPNEKYLLNLEKDRVCMNSNCDEIILYFKFAFYEKIDLLKIKGIEYDKKYKSQFLEEAKSYKILTVIVDNE